MPISIAIIISNDATDEAILDCLTSLAGEIDDGVRAVVVDRGVEDDRAERIERVIEQHEWAAWARVARVPGAGLLAANAAAMRSVDADAYLLLDGTARVQPGLLRLLRDAQRTRPDAGIIGPELRDARGRRVNSAFRDLSPISELLRGMHGGALDRMLERFRVVLPHAGRPFDPDWVAFDCVLIRHEVFERIGDLDDLGEFSDADFCRRARTAAFRVLHWPQAKVTFGDERSTPAGAGAAARTRPPRMHYLARARYFARFYGRIGLWKANLLWYLGRCLALPRELFGDALPAQRKHEAFDLWINAWQPLRGDRAHVQRMRARAAESGEHPLLPRGSSGAHNQNPRDIGLLALIAEDFRTYDSKPIDPGLWMVVLHRLGNARMDLRPRALRAPFSLLYRVAFTAMNWLWGIDLSYAVKLGRRVRIWHHGGIVLNAESIGDDVHIRHNTTFGIVRLTETDQKPRIGNRCDIGVGVCVLGDVTVGDDCVIGANSVVLSDLPAGSTAVGAPARAVHSNAQHRRAQQSAREDTAPVSRPGRTNGEPLRLPRAR